MSDFASQYVDFLLKKYFGDLAVAIVQGMHIKGPISLKEIEQRTEKKFKLMKVHTCVLNLLRHRVLCYLPGKINKYNISLKDFEHLSRFNIYCKLGLLYYGKISEDILLSIFVNGIAKASEIVRCVFLKSDSDFEDLKKAEVIVDSLDNLLKTKILKATTNKLVELVPSTECVPTEEHTGNFKNELLASLQKFISGGGKVEHFRKNLPSDKASHEWDLVLSPNYETIEALWRDQIIAQLTTDRIDKTAGEIISRFLCVATASDRKTHITSEASEAVSYTELIRSFKEIPKYLDSYITLLLDDAFCLLAQQSGNTGQMYTCPYKKIIKKILILHVEHMIQVIYDNSGLRIFRMLIADGYLSHDTLEKRLLIPQQDFRKILPKMVADGFISSTEFSKSKDFTSDSIVCLYHVNLPLLARQIIEYAQHALFRLGIRSDSEIQGKSRLIEQRYRIENLIQQHQQIIDNSSETTGSKDAHHPNNTELEHHQESLVALKASLSTVDLEKLSSLTARLAKLSASEWQANSAWFLADLYLRLYCG